MFKFQVGDTVRFISGTERLSGKDLTVTGINERYVTVREDGADTDLLGSVDEFERAEPDLVNHPPHYTSHPSGIEAIEIAEAMNYNLGNVIKYVFRCDLKGDPIKDLKKAVWYLNREIKRRTA